MMLHKSFKPAKCKTSLKLAASRIKLLKNKKEVQVRHLKGDLAKLLETGQNQTARIRVEHLVREEKSKEAYELIEIFCELIAARLPMIESQKNCPIDLKEAVSSVIFASPRCEDIPELMDVRKHFRAKYGKEFVSAAVELRPNCGVNRLLVEKLSVKAPDGPNKVKILTAIAEEHNIKWDPNSFSENSLNPPADLLNGPNTFEKANKIQMEPIGVPPSLIHHNNKGSPSVQVPFVSDERNHIPENFSQQSFRSNLHSQKSDSTEANARRNTVTGHHISEQRSSDINEEGMRFRHSNSGDQQHWNMDFKDATAAAQAAAESAERASFAARAAAELCSRGSISRQSFSELEKSSSHNSRADGSPGYATSILQDQHFKDQVASAPHTSFMMDDNKMHNDTKRSIEDEADKSCDPSTKKSSAINIDAYPSVTNFDAADTYSLKNSSEPRIAGYPGSESMKNRNSDVEYVGDHPHDTGFEEVSYFGEVRIENDSNRYVDENPFAMGMGKTNDSGNTIETRFNDDASVVFDDYVPDDDFELEDNYHRKESILELSSHRGEASISSSAAIDTWIPKPNKHESSEKFVSHSKIPEECTPFAGNLNSFEDHFHSDVLFPATYDHSDGPSSESEEESGKSEIIGKKNSGEFSKNQNLYSERSEWTHNSSHGLAGASSEKKRSTTSPCVSSTHSLDNEVKEIASPPSSPDTIQEETTLEGSNGFNFGKLKGGLRNQKGSRGPYANNSLGSDLPSRRARENDALKTEQSTSFSSFTGDRNVEEKPDKEKGSGAKSSRFKSHLDDSEDEFLDNISSGDQGSHSDKVSGEISKKSTSRLTAKYGLFDDDDSDGDSSRRNTNSPRLVIGVSRRTKTSPKSPISYSEDSYGIPTSCDDGSERKASRSHYASTALLNAKTRTNYSDHLTNSEQPRSSRTFKQTSETNRYFSDERVTSSSKEQPSNSPQKLDAQDSSENSKFSFSREKITAPFKTKVQINNSDYLENPEQPRSTRTSKPIPEPKRSFHEEKSSSLTKEAPSDPSPKLGTQSNNEGSSSTKASHVHPKLPDYNNFAAHFMSLRQNHK